VKGIRAYGKEEQMIPEEKREAVDRGLKEAFGTGEFEDIRRLNAALTADLVYRIVVKGQPYLLRIIVRAKDPADHFTCMRAAADAGLAPRIWYASVEERLAITDFVDAVPFPLHEARLRMPVMLKAVHALSPFPSRASHLNTSCTFLLDKSVAVPGLIERFRAAKALPAAETDELVALYEQLVEAYARCESDMVSSHNDLLRPENVLFDGQRVWLVDWEAAFRNDRYVDLAVVANFVVRDEADEKAYLEAYFGEPPNEYQSARFVLMRQLAHLFYAMAFLWLGAGQVVDVEAEDFRHFHDRVWAGGVDLGDKAVKVKYGQVHREQLLRNVSGERYRDALRMVAG
jgi:hypothetical protein